MVVKCGGRKFLRIVGKSIASLLLITLLAITVTSISPIYNFAEPKPFSGEDIFNPYKCIDPGTVWQRANFHTHTRIDSPLNECDYTPRQTLDAYEKLGYDYVAFTNHNYLTEHPNREQHISAYEHGYNLLKYHKVVDRKSVV